MEIRNFDAYSPLHKSGHTSKGDQLKWKIDDRWYKADYMGYEGLSEVLVSDLLQKSTCPFPFVEYEAAVIEYNGKIFQGCSSLDFLKANQVLIPLEKLYRRYTGESLAVKLSDFADVSERIQYLVTQVEEITKIDNFGAYLTAMLEIDAFFMNEDRHTNNIAVIYNEKTQKYELSPFFDQGLCMFADINQDYLLISHWNIVWKKLRRSHLALILIYSWMQQKNCMAFRLVSNLPLKIFRYTYRRIRKIIPGK